jgi:hypothetical protein
MIEKLSRFNESLRLDKNLSKRTNPPLNIFLIMSVSSSNQQALNYEFWNGKIKSQKIGLKIFWKGSW